MNQKKEKKEKKKEGKNDNIKKVNHHISLHANIVNSSMNSLR